MDMLSKLKNFWYYYKVHLLIALAVIAVGCYLGLQSAGTPKPDYHIGIVRSVPLREETLASMEATFAAAGEDLNGDGEVLVQLHTYWVDLADDSPNAGVSNAQTIAALDADLVGHICSIFLLDDVQTFHTITNGILSETVTPFREGLYLTIRADAETSVLQLVENLH